MRIVVGYIPRIRRIRVKTYRRKFIRVVMQYPIYKDIGRGAAIGKRPQIESDF